MKILLIYPYYSETTTTFFKFLKNKIPPLGLLYIGSALKIKGHEVKIIDAETKNLKLEKLGTIAKNYNPRVIGISTTTPTFKRARETATYLKELLPNVTIVFG
ncbi:MAG: cobalamin B12-binding domain-containing protein, partial [Nanoarchaeota archaeon]|nr:cobalamin B12-binding domain-containing protein [Nanoarchaeota archaeon]